GGADPGSAARAGGNPSVAAAIATAPVTATCLTPARIPCVIAGLSQRHRVGQHRAPLDRHEPELGLLIERIGALHGEVRAGGAQGGAGDGVGEPVRVVLEALKTGGGAQAVSEEAPHPAVIVVPRSREQRAPSKAVGPGP